jgi:4-azaleucine resistance transporter AzlC
VRGRRVLGSTLSGYLEGARAVSALAVAIGAFGVSFGVLARSAGISPWAAVVMSGTTFGGSAQFAAASVLEAGGTALVAVGAGALLNARYGVMGMSAAPTLRGPAWRRVLLAQLVVDESWAVAHRTDGSLDRDRLIGAALLLYVVHVGATAVGAFGAGAVADPSALGLDAAFPAMFLVLLRPHLARPGARSVAGAGAILAVALTPLLPPGAAILAAASAVVLGLRRT